jgi:hypothetical protein
MQAFDDVAVLPKEFAATALQGHLEISQPPKPHNSGGFDALHGGQWLP